MRKAKVLFKNESRYLDFFDDGSFSFRYSDIWITDQTKPSTPAG